MCNILTPDITKLPQTFLESILKADWDLAIHDH